VRSDLTLHLFCAHRLSLMINRFLEYRVVSWLEGRRLMNWGDYRSRNRKRLKVSLLFVHHRKLLLELSLNRCFYRISLLYRRFKRVRHGELV